MDSEQRAQLREWAKQLERESEHAEARAAARAVLLLSDRVEELEGELAAARVGERPREARPSRRRRDRGRSADEPETSWRRAPRLGARVPHRRALLTAAALVAVAFAGLGVAGRVTAPELVAGGTAPDAKVGADGLLSVRFWVEADPAHGTAWRLDGRDVTSEARVESDRLVLRPRDLADGAHTVEARRSGRLPGATTQKTWRISVDTVAPRIAVPANPLAAAPARPLTVEGTVTPGSTLTADGDRVVVRGGRFAVRLEEPPSHAVRLVAGDAYGNRSERIVRVVLVPRPPSAPVRAVHVTARAWADPGLRRGVLRLVDTGRVDAVELDLKDEAGEIGFRADIPFARSIGAFRRLYDLHDAVQQLHARGARVIGRLVCFRDPVHAAAAWKAGRRDEVVQTPSGGPYAGYGGFTNVASPAVRRYEIDVAVAAARAGVDEILYDYVRRPDGPIEGMRFPGLKGTPESAIVRFLHETRRALRPYDVFLGASVFGIAATRPREVAQDIPRMARQVDYVAPMVYPSHWTPGEYDVAYPNGQPYDIVVRSLRDFVRQTRNTGARVVPWLQDFTLGVTYGPAEVSAQIRAAHDAGIDEWLLWDPLVTYTADGLARHARLPAVPTRAAGG